MAHLASVLLIEDNAGDARLVREYLSERFGAACELHAAATLDTGLQWLAQGSADVILLDLSLPDSSGLQTYMKVSERAPRTPVVILSGHDDDELALDAVRAGAEDYLAKQHADGASLARTMRHAVERRRVEQALRDSEERYRTIVETAEEGILQLDAQGAVVFANARMARMIERPLESLAGQPFEDLVEASYRGLARHLLHGSHCGARATAELRFQRAQRGALWTLAAAGTIRSHAGELGSVVMLSDITGRVLAEQELARIARQLERRVEERTAELQALNAELQFFNESIAHDLRTPLAAVTGFAQLLAGNGDNALSAAGQRQLDGLRAGTRDMEERVGGLLALSRVGRSEIRRERLDLSALAEAVIEQLRLSEPHRAVLVRIEPGLQAHGDPALMRCVLDNLLGNAWKYTSRTPCAELRFGRLTAADGSGMFVVDDNGIGFDMRTAGRLFAPFERLPSARGYPGTGIGLASARRIIERHGGRIWADSRPGDSTRFFFTLEGATRASV